MQIGILLTAIAIGVLVFLGLVLPSRISAQNNSGQNRRTRGGASNPFHAVSIEPAQEGCLAADTIKAQRFLSEDAPGLPLPDCIAEGCDCKYIHHTDRRDGSRDRRLVQTKESRESEVWMLRERRNTGGRRYEDMAAA